MVALSKIKKNDGGHKICGVDFDPNGDLVHNTHEDGSYTAYHKGQKMKYDDYISELESRVYRNSKGKSITNSFGYFGGLNFDSNGKII